jgi:hypothetical protein
MNYARLKAPLDDPSMDEFFRSLGPINALAKSTPGYVWSLDLDDEELEQQRSQVDVLRNDDLMMPQLSLWEDVESVQHFAFKSGHAMYLKRKREWFTSPTCPYTVCWWWSITPLPVSTFANMHGQSDEENHEYDDGVRSSSTTESFDIDNNKNNNNDSKNLCYQYPTLQDAFERLDLLKRHGPSQEAFTFKTSKDFPKPSI